MGKWWEGGNKSLLSKSYTYQNWFWRFGEGRQLLLCVLGAAEAMERVAVCKRMPQCCPTHTVSDITGPRGDSGPSAQGPLFQRFPSWTRAHTHSSNVPSRVQPQKTVQNPQGTLTLEPFSHG